MEMENKLLLIWQHKRSKCKKEHASKYSKHNGSDSDKHCWDTSPNSSNLEKYTQFI